MQTLKKILKSLALLLFVLVLPKDAHAYVDPGTGSYVLQFVLAFVFGGLFLAKTFWRKVITLLRKPFTKKKVVKDEEK